MAPSGTKHEADINQDVWQHVSQDSTCCVMSSIPISMECSMISQEQSLPRRRPSLSSTAAVAASDPRFGYGAVSKHLRYESSRLFRLRCPGFPAAMVDRKLQSRAIDDQMHRLLQKSLRLRTPHCFDRGNVFQYWRTKLEEACVGCFAPQISCWNDSDGVPLALVFAQEHGAGLEACRRVARRGREAALCAEILRNGEVRHRFGVRCWPFC